MRYLLIAIIFFLSGCAYKLVNYSPNYGLDEVYSMQVLTQYLREHSPEGYTVKEVEVTEGYFKVEASQLKNTKFLFINKGITSIDNSIFVYFNSIDNVRLFHKKDWVVQVLDDAGQVLFRFSSHKEEKAKLFADAIMSLAIEKSKYNSYKNDI